ALPVSILKRRKHLQRDLNALLQSQRAACETLRESFSIEKLHNEIIDTSVLPHVVKGANSRMIEFRYQVGFLSESSLQFLSHERRRSNSLQSNDSIQFEIRCSIDLAHATPCDELFNAESVADDLPWPSEERCQHRAWRLNSIC